jgi:hypothetical protein
MDEWFVSNSNNMFSGNTKLSSYCLHYFTVSSYSYYVTLKSSSCRLHFRMNFLAGSGPNAEIYASYHRRRERQLSLHICKFTMCSYGTPKIHYHTFTLKTFPLGILAQFRSTLQVAAPQKAAASRANWHVWNVRTRAVNITTTVFRMWRPTVWQIGTI